MNWNSSEDISNKYRDNFSKRFIKKANSLRENESAYRCQQCEWTQECRLEFLIKILSKHSWQCFWDARCLFMSHFKTYCSKNCCILFWIWLIDHICILKSIKLVFRYIVRRSSCLFVCLYGILYRVFDLPRRWFLLVCTSTTNLLAPLSSKQLENQLSSLTDTAKLHLWSFTCIRIERILVYSTQNFYY